MCTGAAFQAAPVFLLTLLLKPDEQFVIDRLYLIFGAIFIKPLKIGEYDEKPGVDSCVH